MTQSVGPITLQTCLALQDRCRDPNVPWPYHPRNGLGDIVTTQVIKQLAVWCCDNLSGIQSSGLVCGQRVLIGKGVRSRRIDLVIHHPKDGRALVAIETKACMTAHAKAVGRLAAELVASSDAAAQAGIPLFALVAVNYASSFTSPLNLPGPNRQHPEDGKVFTKKLSQKLDSIFPEGRLLFLPMDFDNERYCSPHSADADCEFQENRFVSEIASELKSRSDSI